MLMPSIFGEDLFNDDFMNGFKFPDVDKVLYGKHASNVMKTDVRETESGYEVDIDLPGFKKDEISASLENPLHSGILLYHDIFRQFPAHFRYRIHVLPFLFWSSLTADWSA